MLYSKRIVRCSARGLSRDDARNSLESSPQFKQGSEVLDLRRRGEQWIATLLEPHTAEFPPPKDDDGSSEAPEKTENSEESPSKSEDGPPKPDGPPEAKGGEKAEIAALLDLMTAIADKLGVVPGGAVPGAEDSPMPGGPEGPPPGPPAPDAHGGVGGPGHQEVVHRTKLKPGDTPPGVTPIGSPAFASTQDDLARVASFDAFDDTPGKSIKAAKAELEEMYGPLGFQVRQIKRVEDGQRLAAKLSRR